MKKDLIEELLWIGIIKNFTPGIQNKLKNKSITIYMGIDPTSKSIHIGNLLPIITLIRFKMFGHIPLIVIGGATCMVGDPSGKYKKRCLLETENDIFRAQTKSIQNQLFKLFKTTSKTTYKYIKFIDNYNWLKTLFVFSFLNEIGKYIHLNYMMNKDSVTNRICKNHNGISFTEFTYPLIQGYDFLHLYCKNNCTFQLGGSDQWGNITTGIDLIRKKLGGSVYGLTCHLLTKSDGTKFGKSELGENIWLEYKLTSPYKFYQFWINLSDKESENYLKMYTFLAQVEIKYIITTHRKELHNRICQKKLAYEITKWIHGKSYLKRAIEASGILFSNHTINTLKCLDAKSFLSIFNGVPTFKVSIEDLKKGFSLIEIFLQKIKLFTYNKSALRSIKDHSLLVNKKKVNDSFIVTEKNLISRRYILIQKGKKTYCLIEVF